MAGPTSITAYKSFPPNVPNGFSPLNFQLTKNTHAVNSQIKKLLKKTEEVAWFLLQQTEKRSWIRKFEQNSSEICMKRSKVSISSVMKKLRSKLPRRRRSGISPILYKSLKSGFSFAVPLKRDVSCDSVASSHLTTASAKPPLKKRGFEEVFAGGDEFRRFTRSYYRRIENEKRKNEVELSESSCVDSCFGVENLEANSRVGKGNNALKEVERIEDSEAVTGLEVSSFKAAEEKVTRAESSLKIAENDVVSVNSGVQQFCVAKFGTITSYIDKSLEKSVRYGENEAYADDVSEVSRNCGESKFTASNAESVATELIAMDYDLVCLEQVSYENTSDYSSAFSELQSEIFQESSDIDFSEYTPSIWCDSGSQFSEKSIGDSSPSPTFQLFLQFSQQFCRSTTAYNSRIEGDNSSDEIILMRFEDEEHEESYQMIRKRERKQVYLHDYAEDYCSSTDCGELVIQQRLQMVHWIVEQSTKTELQRETMFLGVNLLDRFLSKGYFKNKRSLQIAGIACLTLATRIEENQPHNSVQQKTFYIGSISYSRCEVVAMEWLVQDVLNFQCFLPTMYNFLWFYLKAAGASEEVEKTAKYLAVLALLGHEQLCYWPSTVAASLVILTSLAANQDKSCHRVTETHSRSKDDNLAECIKSLQWLVKYIC